MDRMTEINELKSKKKPRDYSAWRKILEGERLPAAVVDLAAFDRNVAKVVKIVSGTGKTVRIATKSVRVPALIRRALDKGGKSFRGLMCYAVEEAEYLHTKGMDDFLIAYPTVQPSDLRILRRLQDSGVKISLVVDSLAQIKLINEAMKSARKPLPVVIEMDMSLRLLWGLIHLGVRRSPVRTAEDLKRILVASRNYPFIKVIGVMAYEATVAGLIDRDPFNKIFNPIKTVIRKLSAADVARKRKEVPTVFKEVELELKIFNGGGTGSVNSAAREKPLTEVTVGSALLCPTRVDWYSNLSNIGFEPAEFFALPTVRTSDPGYVTCSGGGYIASGDPGWDKLLIPVSPSGLQLLSAEGCGEVQTPFKVKGSITPEFGWPIMLRPAKAGELFERFNEVLLVKGDEITQEDKITGRVPTYRGLGLCTF